MQLIPPELVPLARGYLLQKGQNPDIFGNGGSLDGGALTSILYNQVEIRTSATPPLIFPIGPAGPPTDSATEALIQQLQPTIIFTGPAGRLEIAPYGAASGASSWIPFALLGGAIVLGIGWLVWGK